VIDLTKECTLRSDKVFCGGIKKERIQGIYPAFLPAFYTAYEHHKEYLYDKETEPEYRQCL